MNHPVNMNIPTLVSTNVLLTRVVNVYMQQKFDIARKLKKKKFRKIGHLSKLTPCI